MKKLVAVVLLGSILVALAPIGAHAHGGAAAAALALGAFATLGVLTAPFWAYPAYAYPPRAYYAPPAHYYSTPPVVYSTPPAAATPPAIRREVVYPHGRHVLYGDGVTTAYQWVWVPNPPAPPDAAPPAPSSR